MATWRDAKKRHRQDRARKGQLPASYHEAIERLALTINHAARAEV